MTDEQAKPAEVNVEKVNDKKLNKEEQVQNLIAVYNFLRDFDRVPGTHVNAWSQVLNNLVLVIQSLQQVEK